MMQSWVGPAIEGSGQLISLGGRHADYLWGKDIEKRRYLGSRYLGGNPAMAGRYQGEFANLRAVGDTYYKHEKPKFTKWAEVMGPVTEMVGQGLQMKSLSASEKLKFNKDKFTTISEDGVQEIPNRVQKRWDRQDARMVRDNISNFESQIGAGPTQTEPGFNDPYLEPDYLIPQETMEGDLSYIDNYPVSGFNMAQNGILVKDINTLRNAYGARVIEDVEGRDHEEGGEKRVLNGVPVEVEDEELILRMPNGSIAVLNEGQQKMLASGVPLSKIVRSLPKVSNKAQDGTEIPPEMMQGYLNEPEADDFPYVFNTERNTIDREKIRIVDPVTGIETVLGGETVFSIPENSDIFGGNMPDIEIAENREYDRPPSITRPIITPRVGSTPGTRIVTPRNTDTQSIEFQQERGNTAGGGVTPGDEKKDSTSPDVKKIIEKYKLSQRIGLWGNLGQSFAEAAANYFDYLNNEDEPPPRDIEGVPPVWASFTPINPEPAIRNLNKQTRSAMRTANEFGRSELTPSISAAFGDSLNKLFSEVEGVNAQTRNALNQLNINASIEANKLNIQTEAQNIQQRFAWDMAMSQAQQSNLSNMFAALRAMGAAGQGYSSNVLSADVVEYLLSKGRYDIAGEIASRLNGQPGQ